MELSGPKIFARAYLVVALCLALLAGCVVMAHPVTDMWIASMRGASFALYWREAVDRQYPGAIMVAVHGRTGPDGTWWVFPDRMPAEPVVALLARVRLHYPDRTIVMLVCNPGGHLLPSDITNVVYALKNVWLEPDWVMDPREAVLRETMHGDAAGSLKEFVHVP